MVHAGAQETGGVPAPAAPASASPPPKLPLLRRDAPAATTPWPSASTWVLLTLAGGAGGWWAWQRAGRRVRSLRSQTSGAGVAIVRLSSHALTPHASVHALRWGSEELLLGCTAQQVQLVARRSLPAGQEAEDA